MAAQQIIPKLEDYLEDYYYLMVSVGRNPAQLVSAEMEVLSRLVCGHPVPR